MSAILPYFLPLGVIFVCMIMAIIFVVWLNTMKQSQASQSNAQVIQATAGQIVQPAAPTLDQIQRIIDQAVQRSRADEVRKSAPAPLNRTDIYEHLEAVIGVFIDNEVPDESWQPHVNALTQILNGLRRPKKAA